MIERQPSRPPRHYSKRHRSPGYVHRPAVRHSKLNHKSHQQKRACSQSGCEAENEEDGKENLSGADKECSGLRRGKRVRAAGQMQLELIAEKEDRYVVQLEETVPFVDAGSPEWSREGDAQHKLGERRLGDPFNNRIHPLGGAPDRQPYVLSDLRQHVVSFLHKGPS